MVGLDIYGGLLGAGKTTLIKKMLNVAYAGFKVAIIENEIGKINLDSAEFRNTQIKVKELTAGCVCCTLQGNLTYAVAELIRQEKPDFIIIEPTGLADFSGVIKACLDTRQVFLNRCVMIVNSRKNQTLMKVVGPFYIEQLKIADTIYMNFTEKMSADDIEKTKERLHSVNPNARIVTIPIHEMTEDPFQSETKVSDHANPGQKSDLLPSEPFSAKSNRKQKVKITVEEAGSSNPVRMLPGSQMKLYTWSYSFQKEMSENDIEKLKEILSDSEHCDIWRAKGYLRMSEHSVYKIDAAFGEMFEEIRMDGNDQKIGTLVLIGKKIDSHWLTEQFKMM